MQKNSSDNYSQRFGIESFALAREWIFKPFQESQINLNSNSKINDLKRKKIKPMKAGDLYLFLDEIHSRILGKQSKAMANQTSTSITEKLRKRYDPYLRKFSEKFGFEFNFQDKTLNAQYESNYLRIHTICKAYLQDFAYSYNDDALMIAIRNWATPGDLLYFLVVIRYAIELGFPIEIIYKKIMFFSNSSRRLIPYLIKGSELGLGLICLDLNDNTVKSFLLSRVVSLKSDFMNLYYQKSFSEKKINFDYLSYNRENPRSKFMRQEITYTVEMNLNNYDLLLHSKLWQIKKLNTTASQKNWVVVEISTYDERAFFDTLFNYGTFVKILEPIDACHRYIDELSRIKKL